VELTRQGNPSYRCLTLETRQKLLRQLLLVQEQIRKEAPDPTIALIDFEELCAIREVWRAEGDWEDSLPHIYRQVTGHDEAWPVSQDEDWMNASTKEALLYHCQRRHLNPQLVIELLEAWKLFSRSMSVPREHAENQENAVELTPLFAEDPVTVAQQKAMRRLVEVVANLFENRDWRSHEERLAEVIAQHQTEQEQPSSCYTLPTWLPRRLKDE
jgi:hypothetical protein